MKSIDKLKMAVASFEMEDLTEEEIKALEAGEPDKDSEAAEQVLDKYVELAKVVLSNENMSEEDMEIELSKVERTIDYDPTGATYSQESDEGKGKGVWNWIREKIRATVNWIREKIKKVKSFFFKTDKDTEKNLKEIENSSVLNNVSEINKEMKKRKLTAEDIVTKKSEEVNDAKVIPISSDEAVSIISKLQSGDDGFVTFTGPMIALITLTYNEYHDEIIAAAEKSEVYKIREDAINKRMADLRKLADKLCKLQDRAIKAVKASDRDEIERIIEEKDSFEKEFTEFKDKSYSPVPENPKRPLFIHGIDSDLFSSIFKQSEDYSDKLYRSALALEDVIPTSTADTEDSEIASYRELISIALPARYMVSYFENAASSVRRINLATFGHQWKTLLK